MDKEEKSTHLLPVEEELIYRAGWSIRLRWLAAAGLILCVIIVKFFLNFPIHWMPLLIVGLVVAAYNVVFKISFERSKKNLPEQTKAFSRLTNFQVGTDWIALLLLVHYTGGIESPLIFCFVFHIIMSAILLSRRNCCWHVSLATGFLVLLAFLEYSGVIAHIEMTSISAGRSYNDFLSVVTMLSFSIVTMWVVGYLATSVTTKLRQREKNLLILEENLEKAYRELETVARAKSEFVLAVTHELRSPLSSIQSSLTLFTEGYLGRLSVKQQECVERIEERSKFLLMLVDDLLSLAQLRENTSREKRTKVDLTSIVNLVADSIRPQVQCKDLTLQLILPSYPLYTWTDEEEMGLLFSNLIGNAVKYTPPKGEARVKIWKEGLQVRAEVSDTGIGIGEEDLKKIFKEFYRSKNAKKLSRRGTGLGLPIVKKILQKYGGEITVQSEIGKGSNFSFRLPAYEE